MEDYTLFTKSGKVHSTTTVYVTECAKLSTKAIETFAKKEMLRKIQELARGLSDKDAAEINAGGKWIVPATSIESEGLEKVDNAALAAETNTRVNNSSVFTDEEKKQYNALMAKFAAK